MSPERWQQIKRVFQAALELPVKDRTAFVEHEAVNDAGLQAEVESLLSAHGEAASFIEQPLLEQSAIYREFNSLFGAVEPDAELPDKPDDDLFDDALNNDVGSDDKPANDVDEDEATFVRGEGRSRQREQNSKRRVGAYRMVCEIGRGGMGAVFLAERADGEFRQQVAIKLIKRGMDTDFVLRRFRNERQILAALDHPHIARLLDGGTTSDGLPYFVMEYVAGSPVHDFCDRERLTISERLRLFCHICEAVSHAHLRGVIHRDIKPGNVIVTIEGTPKLLDFGIAKLLNPELAAQTLAPTLTALRLMTPEYASPEQVSGSEISFGSDIYSLGVLLYELVTGHRPHVFKNRSPHELSRVICEVEPALPSQAIYNDEPRSMIAAHTTKSPSRATVIDARRTDIESLRREIEGNLDCITLRALRKNPDERYATVDALRLDVMRHLEGHPVSASFVFPSSSVAPIQRRRASDKANTTHALAILPFRLLNRLPADDTGDDYLGLGLADSLITRLGGLSHLVVRPTSSVMRFQQAEAEDSLSIGRELGASFVLEGRIQRAGTRLRVTAQLLEVATGATRWAQVFDEPSTDVLSLQDSLTQRVAEALVPHLSSDEREQLSKRGTNNAAAFEAYLRGRYHWSAFTEEGFAKAITCYYRAIALDPDYALAYAGIADYYNWIGVYSVMPSNECFAAANEAARRAIALDGKLADAYTALGFAVVGGSYAWAEGERCHQRALELDANCATAHIWYSLQLAMEARFDEAITNARRSVELDPLAPFNRYNLGWVLYHARRYSDSLEVQRKLLTDEPNYGIAHFGYGYVMLQLARFEEAFASLSRARDLMPGVSFVCAALGIALAGMNDKAKAREVLDEMRAVAQKRFVSPYHLALVHAALHEKDAAFTELEKTYQLKDAWLNWLGVEPALDVLRDDKRYHNLLDRLEHPAREHQVSIAAAQQQASVNLPPTPPSTGRQSTADHSTYSSVTSSPISNAPVLPTLHQEAYQHYIAGRYYSTRRTADGMRAAIERFKQAVAIDETFALAYAELADCYSLLNWYVEPPPADAFENARHAAHHAVRLNPQLADARASLGFVKLHYERDFNAAELEFQKAIGLRPDNAVAHRWYAFTLSAMARHTEAINEIRTAQKIAPRSPVIATAVANILFFARRFDDALAQCEEALELDAGSVAAYVILRWASEAKGLHSQARAAFEQERIFAGDTATTRAKHAHVLAATGRNDEARLLLHEVIDNRPQAWVTSYEIAVIFALLDEADDAFEWLDYAAHERAVGLTFAAVDPHLDNIRADYRFNELLKRNNLLV